MIQVYPFHGTDLQEVYGKLNSFLNEVAIIGVMVAPEDIRANTKYYPDWDRTATTIEVFIRTDALSPDANANNSEFRDLHRAIVEGKPEQAPEPEPSEQAEKPARTSDDFDPFIDSDDMP